MFCSSAICLIDTFGIPAFVKIDVEGREPAVLAGLGRALPALSFRYLPRALDDVQACLARLLALEPYGSTRRLVNPANSRREDQATCTRD